jgi:hypothetical protein
MKFDPAVMLQLVPAGHGNAKPLSLPQNGM